MTRANGDDVLLWAARIGGVSSADVALRFGLTERGAGARLRRLAADGLLESSRLLHHRPALWLTTRAGLRAAGLAELEPCRVSAGGFAHMLACSTVAARLEAAGAELCSERELRIWERAAGRPLASAELGLGSHGERVLHRPDLVVWHRGAATALEVELTVKAAARLRRIVRGWARSRCVSSVLYLCPPVPAHAVRRAAVLEQAAASVGVLALDGWREEEVLENFSRESKSSVPSRA